MNILAELSNLILWIVAGVVGIMSEGIRRTHSRMLDLKQENEQRRDEIRDIRKHLGLDEDGNGPGRIDTMEKDIGDIGQTLERHEIYWTGDPDDPAQLGALGNLYNINSKLDRIEKRETGEE